MKRATVKIHDPDPADTAPVHEPPPAPVSDDDLPTDEDDEGEAQEAVRPASDKPATPPKEPSKDPKLSPVMRKIRDEEESSLHDWLSNIGGGGGVYRVQLRRKEPRKVISPTTGQEVQVAGHLHTYDEFPDEEQIKNEWGGGTFQVSVQKENEKGSFKFQNHRIVTIAGSPRVDRLPGSTMAGQASAPATSHEDPGVVRAALGMFADQLKAKDRPQERGIDPAVQLMMEQNRETMAALQRQIASLQSENASIRNQKPPEDPFREKMLANLLDGDSARLTALRSQHESELRQLKEGHVQDMKRVEDRHDRTIEAMRKSHDDALAAVKQSYEREIAAMRATSEVAALSTKTMSEVQAHTLDSEIKRLTRDNDELRREVKELREKKDKSILDSIEEVNKLKELVGDGDAAEKTGFDKFFDAVTSPTAVEGFGKIISRVPGLAGAAAPDGMVPNPAAPPRPRIVEDRAGNTFVQVGNRITPAKRRPKVVTTDSGNQIEVPPVDADTIKTMLNLLETAYGNKMEPATVAQTARPHIPPEVMGWIQENGIDLFMSKVAKLPGTSPLVSQAGKNWLRAVGQALTG